MAGIDEVLSRVRLAIPTLSPTNYKGQAGQGNYDIFQKKYGSSAS